MHKFTHLFYLVIIAVMGILIYTLLQQPVETTNADYFNTQETSETKPGDGTITALETEMERIHFALQEARRVDREARMESEQIEILQRVENEPRNADWAEPIEAAISNLYRTEEALSDAELIEATCRTTVCKFVVSSGELGLGLESGMLVKAIGEEKFTNRALTIIHHPRKNNTTLILIELEPRPAVLTEDDAG
jgi:hypothetical protein